MSSYSRKEAVLPFKNRLSGLKKSSGRNNSGRITVWHKGGGHKKRFRLLNYTLPVGPFSVRSIEYSPLTRCHISRIVTESGQVGYIPATDGVVVGKSLKCYSHHELSPLIEIGNRMPIKSMPLGAEFHLLESKPGIGFCFIRSAGTYGTLLQKANESSKCRVKLPSGEERLVSEFCKGTLGRVSNVDSYLKKKKKAGQSRWEGVRPCVRGVAMNPIDHPHGGGEGKTSGGRLSSTPWGRLTKGYKTLRKKKKNSLILVRSRAR